MAISPCLQEQKSQRTRRRRPWRACQGNPCMAITMSRSVFRFEGPMALETAMAWPFKRRGFKPSCRSCELEPGTRPAAELGSSQVPLKVIRGPSIPIPHGSISREGVRPPRPKTGSSSDHPDQPPRPPRPDHPDRPDQDPDRPDQDPYRPDRPPDPGQPDRGQKLARLRRKKNRESARSPYARKEGIQIARLLGI